VPGAQRLARSLVLLMALAVAIAAVLTMVPHDDGGGGGAGGQARPAEVGRDSGAASRGDRPASGRGVGDSQSDDPSDDEDDGPEP
jgi:hypothetical protein